MSAGGGITNSGTISGVNSAGIDLFLVGTFVGGILNSGTISEPFGFGIRAVTTGSFDGGITNSGVIVAHDGITLAAAGGEGGGVTNSGTISAIAFGIEVEGFSTFVGGISNSGVISMVTDGFGLHALGISTLSGNIINSGTIVHSNGAVGAGIRVEEINTFSGNISNSGTISFGSVFGGSAAAAGISASDITTFTGNIINSGTIFVAEAPAGIYVNDIGTFDGGISNTGTITAPIGILVGQSGAVSIFDSGVIVGTGGTAVDLTGNAAGNTFTLGPGYSITGLVKGQGSDTFQLGGTGSGSFALGSIGAGQQYQGFTTFNVVGGAWTVTGSFAPTNPWTVGSGTLVITGSLGNASGVTLSGGTIVIGSNNALGAGTLAMAAGTTLSFLNTGNFTVANPITISGDPFFTPPASTTQTISGAITDGGSPGVLDMQGPGTLVLSGINSYSGGTVISGGTLTFSGPGTLGAASGTTTVNTGGTLDLGGTTQTQAAVNLAGGTLQNGALNAPINAMGGIINNIGGTASLTATAGTTIVEGTDSYSGATNINGGTLDVVGSITGTSAFNVGSGSTLTGTGTVDPLTVSIASGASFTPGTAGVPGTSMSIVGNLAFQSGALYVVYLNSTTSTSASVSGTATLAGTVHANFAPGTYLSRSYDLLHAGGLTGTFSGLTTTGAPSGLFVLDYTSTDVFLDFTASIGTGTALNQNQQNVANTINAFLDNGGALPTSFLPLFGLSGASLANALSQLDGEDGTGAEHAAFELTNAFMGLMLDPFVYGRGGPASGGGPLGFAPDQETSFPPDVALAYAGVLKAPPKQNFEQRWTVWGSAFGGSGRADGDPAAGTNNVTTGTFGFAAGADYHASPDTVLGFALAGSGTNWTLAQALGTGRSDAFQAGVYGTKYFGPAYIGGALAFTNNWFTTNRTAFAGDQLTARFQGQSYGVRVESGYRYAVAAASGVTPYAAIQAQDFHTPTYSETDLTAGGFGLTYNAMSATDTRSELGGRFDALTAWSAMPVQLRARIAWAHDWVSNPALSASFQALPGTSFTVNGAPVPHDSALASAGAQLFFTPNWSLLAKFDGEFAKASQLYAGSGTLRYTW